MQFYFTEVLLMIAALSVHTNGDIPNMHCSKIQPFLNNCLKAYGQTVINECQKNNLDIIPLNPNKLEALQLSPNANIVFNLEGIDIFFSPITITDVDLDLNTGAYSKNVTCKYITMDGDVCAVGTLNDNPIKACGHAIITVGEAFFNYRSSFYIKQLPRVNIYQINSGTGDFSVDPDAEIFGLMDMKCINCTLNDDDQNKLRDLFLACKPDLLSKLGIYIISLFDEGLNIVLRVQSSDDVIY